jgi:putative NADPH-quinone reductase
MSRRILIIQGHPDPAGSHFGHALASAYRKGAEAAGHTVEEVHLADLDYPMLSSEKEWIEGDLPGDLAPVQDRIREAEHLVFFFPLWLGTLPARVKAFLEQVMRPGFAFAADARDGIGERLLKGKSARVVITMGMPGPVYRWYFGAHGYRNLKRNILHFCGIRPVRRCFVGGVAGQNDRGRKRWLERIESLGRKAA